MATLAQFRCARIDIEPATNPIPLMPPVARRVVLEMVAPAVNPALHSASIVLRIFEQTGTPYLDSPYFEVGGLYAVTIAKDSTGNKVTVA